MEPDESLSRLRADAAQKLGSEDVDAYSLDELDVRIALCRAEIARCEARKAFATRHRASAEALFRKS
ncbi:DUF1192 domain-containing protein [Blastomonas fulva]|jgi:uncharacterized small protein (DUF1192 family)|uniref:DUF1192 domain-containing protein n=1 Tax=Blastomonas fulva TaxID=1550728 RepID=UPI0024E225D8|nr:DUF1192 domain-containing protein [Blastomonas fulva]MDK2758389.1 DUF1192 domain-containing protein [Blastomonas fulva]